MMPMMLCNANMHSHYYGALIMFWITKNGVDGAVKQCMKGGGEGGYDLKVVKKKINPDLGQLSVNLV